MRYLRYFLYMFSYVLLMLQMQSCYTEDFSKIRNDDGADLIVSIDDFGKKTLTRAEDNRTDYSIVKDINVILTDGTNITNVLYVDLDNPSLVTDGSGLVNKDPLKFHFSKDDMNGVKDIYVLCNQGDFNSYVNKPISDLLNFKVSSVGVNNVTTLFGKAEERIGEIDEHGGKVFDVSLKRLISMVTVKMNGEGLKDGVVIQPTNISLYNIPVSCTLKPNENINNVQHGVDYPVSWGKIGNGFENTVGGHDGNATSMFMFENLQGTGSYNSSQSGPNDSEYKNEIGKIPPSGKEEYCTYLEIKAIYTYSPADGGKFITGNIIYKLWLGNNITDDFNVTRNTHYRVTLGLKGMGGLREDGKIDNEGNFVADGEDLSWRVETNVNEGGSFVSDVLNVATNGFYAYVPFSVEKGKKYVIVHEGNQWISWIQAYSEKLGGWTSPTEDGSITQYSGKDLNDKGIGLNLNPDLLYVKIYIQFWDNIFWPNITDINKWINEGYREATLVLCENSYSEANVKGKLKIRQWLPMPVFENGGTNPSNADMYVSRIDVYEGVTMPWGPSSMNNKDLSSLKINGLNIQNRPFNDEYGFDKILAIYQNEALTTKLIKYNADEGRPNDALRVALFRAYNAGGSQNTPIFPKIDDPYRYESFFKIGLPTVEEWEKVRLYGVIDPKFPIAPDEYWTSTIDGTLSKAFSYFDGNKGSSRSLNRNENHRVRLIYHKKDYATSSN